MSGFVGNFTGANAAENAKQQATYQQQLEQQREAGITSATNNVDNVFNSTFTPSYYAGQRQNYLNYATPQLNDQYTNQQKQLTYQLARSGNLNSSSAGSQTAGLAQGYNSAAQQIDNTATQAALTAENNVEGARAGLISQINATGDTAGAVNTANAQAAALSTTPSYSALGDLFSTSTSALAQQAAASKAYNLYGGGSYTSPYTVGGTTGTAAPAAVKSY